MTDRRPVLTVIAGTNGAGKSSVIGALLRQHSGHYFNPDEWARRLRQDDPGLTVTEANALAWTAGRDLLQRAIDEGLDYTFETTLGGNTIPLLVSQAAARGHRLVVWYVGLDTPEQHIRRVHQRVERGGHDIPTDKIRERFDRSLENLVTLLPEIDELRLFDNSVSVSLANGEAPKIRPLLHLRDGQVLASVPLPEVPHWAKPVFAAILAG